MENNPNAKFITWFSHPKEPFDSFYYYEPATRVMVRVRLELKREPGNGDDGCTAVFYTPNRYVGFYPLEKQQEILKDWGQNPTKFSANNKNEVVWNTATLITQPKAGNGVCDIEGTNPKDPSYIHIGNEAQLDSKALPPGITKDQLLELAQLAVKLQKDGKLTVPNADGTILAEAINEVLTKKAWLAAPLAPALAK